MTADSFSISSELLLSTTPSLRLENPQAPILKTGSFDL